MNTTSRLVAFVLGLAAVFGVAYEAGQLAKPDQAVTTPNSTPDQPGHGHY